MATSIPVELRELLKKGKFIAMIPQGKKPNMNNFTFVDADSMVGAMRRMLHGENRRGMVLEINSIVDQFISAIRNYEDTDFLPMIIETLGQMKSVGISNLTKTYADSPDTLAELQVCLTNIELQLHKYRQYLPGYRGSNMKSD